MATERQTVFEFKKIYPNPTASFAAADFIISSYEETVKHTPLFPGEVLISTDHHVQLIDERKKNGAVEAYLRLEIVKGK